MLNRLLSDDNAPRLASVNHSTEQIILEELRGQELESCLAKFLANIDYEAMGDFFLTFRSYLRPLDLFETLRDKYEGSLNGAPIAGRYIRVRLFVALRHWILNYYIDDFFTNAELSGKIEHFLGTLAGIGADEILTESRIAKELRRTWDCQKVLYASLETIKQGKVFDHGNLIRTRHYSLQLPVAEITEMKNHQARQSLAESIEMNESKSQAEVGALVSQIEDEIASLQSQYNNRAKHDMYTNVDALENEVSALKELIRDSRVSLRRSPCLVDLDLVHDNPQCQTAHKATADTTNIGNDVPIQRTLKRKPGGILKNAKTIAQLIPSSRYSITSVEDDHDTSGTAFSGLNRTFSLRPLQKPRGAIATHKAFVHDLAKMFHDDRCDEGQDHASIVLEHTLAKLEGRDTNSRKRKSIASINQDDDDDDNNTDSVLHERPMTSSSDKRRKRIGCPDLAEAGEARPVDSSLLSTAEKTSKDNQPGRETDSCVTTGTPALTLFNDKIASWQQMKDLQSTAYPTATDELDDRPSSSNMVSIIEALAIQPLPSITVRNVCESGSDVAQTDYCSFLIRENEAQLVKCLTTIEKAIFLELDWLDFSSCSWSSQMTEDDQDWRDVIDADIGATRLILARVNICTLWIVSEILYTTGLRDRAQLLSKLIDVCQLCRDHNNFSSLVQIISALQHPAVRRLHQTWRLLTTETQKTWSRLQGLSDHRGGWRTLKAVQERILCNPDAFVVPFIGPYLSDLLAIRVSSQPVASKLHATAATMKVLMDMLHRISITEDDKADKRLIDRLVWIRGIGKTEAERLSRLCGE